MLPYSLRLSPRDVLRVNKKGVLLRGTLFDLTYAYSAHNSSRWSIRVPKRVVPKAHDRHRTKRLLREIIRDLSPRLPKTVDVVVTWKQKNAPTSLGPVRLELEYQLQHMHT